MEMGKGAIGKEAEIASENYSDMRTENELLIQHSGRVPMHAAKSNNYFFTFHFF